MRCCVQRNVSNSFLEEGSINSHSDASDSRQAKLAWGTVVVFLIAISWVGATQFAQATQSNFEAPFFVMWNQTNFKLLCIVFPIILQPCTKEQNPAPPVRSIFKWSFLFYVLWIGANYCYTRALISISATAVSALFSTAPAWVFVFSFFILDSRFTILKTLSLLLTIGGVCLTTIPKINNLDKLVGIVLSLSSAIFAALYKTLFKFIFEDLHFIYVCRFLSVLGAINLCLSWSIWFILKETGFEDFDFDHVPWEKLIPACFLGLSFDFFINFGIALTYPLFISLGIIRFNYLLETTLLKIQIPKKAITVALIYAQNLSKTFMFQNPKIKLLDS